jgi:large subunit ribosomal protein L29
MSVDELSVKNTELAKELFNLRFQLHTGRLENTARISSLKKDIARINTVIREMKG